MDKAEAVKKLEEAGIDADVIKTLSGGGANDDRIAALESKLEAEIGKANGILGDKKKAQQKVDELQAKLDELESKDLGEVERLQRDMERLQSKLEQSESQRAELESTYNAEKRSYDLNKIGAQFKWMDNVPESMRALTLEKEFDGIDLGNEVLVADKVKSINEMYSGLLASDAPSGSGSKAGEASSGKTTVTKEQAVNKPLADIAANPLAYVQGVVSAE